MKMKTCKTCIHWHIIEPPQYYIPVNTPMQRVGICYRHYPDSAHSTVEKDVCSDHHEVSETELPETTAAREALYQSLGRDKTCLTLKGTMPLDENTHRKSGGTL